MVLRNRGLIFSFLLQNNQVNKLIFSLYLLNRLRNRLSPCFQSVLIGNRDSEIMKTAEMLLLCMSECPPAQAPPAGRGGPPLGAGGRGGGPRLL